MPEIKYEITEHLGVISETARGWTREVNMISWNGREPKIDVRDWSPDHTKMSKTLSKVRGHPVGALCPLVTNLFEGEF